MLEKKPNKVYDPHLKIRFGYENSKRLKKDIEAQPKIYDGEKLESAKLKVDLPDYEKTLEDTYTYGDVHAKNQDLLMTISELKAMLILAEKGKNVNTKFGKSETLKKLICVTPMNTNKDLKAKIVSKVKIKTDKSKPVTSCSTPKNEQGVASSSSVRRLESKDINSKKRVLQSTKSKSTSKDDVVMISHDKCVPRYALYPNSTVKRAFFTSPVVAKSSKLGATPVVIQIVLWIVNNGCSKHMTGNLKLLRNFIEKFMGTVRFGNDNFAVITRYGDYVQGNLMICHVYYVEGLRHNPFLIGQFYDGDLEVAFRSSTCYVRNFEGEDLLTRSCDSNLNTISIS
ncbi:hypothetical protein Tco_0710304 [Tanacetum coccineum]